MTGNKHYFSTSNGLIIEHFLKTKMVIWSFSKHWWNYTCK